MYHKEDTRFLTLKHSNFLDEYYHHLSSNFLLAKCGNKITSMLKDIISMSLLSSDKKSFILFQHLNDHV